MESGATEKIQIFSYTDKKLTKPNEAVNQPFYLPVNPESYSQNFKVETDNRKGHGNQGTDPRYKSTAPEELKLDFIFDGTGAIENYRYTGLDNKSDPEKKSVKNQLKLFLDTVYNMEGKIHRPNFLKIHWGEYLKFPCILSSLDLTYQLFEKNGDPLRVKISATFLNYMAQEEREAREKKKSPDLTHLRLIKAGDRLDLLTFDIYDDSKYMLQVARANNLTTLRKVKPGTELRFPPIDKTERS